MRIDIANPADCCGCTACESICAHNAIQMQADSLGFFYPKVDNDLCVDCGLCQKVCKFQGEYVPNNSFEEPEVYAVRHVDEAELARSQSGAAFWAFAESVLNEGWVIYGVGYDDKLHVIHKRVETIESCQELRGSKYSQSDLRGVFREIKKNLQQGEKILFTGTPCQVAGLKSYIPNKLHQNLLTIDLVCHAVPSPKVWEEYVKWIEEKYKDKVVATDFRNKKFGWRSHVETFKLKTTGKEIKRSTFRFFYFLNDHLAVRKSCAKCKFTNLKRPGDLTIGDFWGWENNSTEWNDNKGISLLLINTEKGKQLFEQVNTRFLNSIKSNTTDCLQPQLIEPIEVNKNQEIFVEELQKFGFNYVVKKYGDTGICYKLKALIRVPYYALRDFCKVLVKQKMK